MTEFHERLIKAIKRAVERNTTDVLSNSNMFLRETSEAITLHYHQDGNWQMNTIPKKELFIKLLHDNEIFPNKIIMNLKRDASVDEINSSLSKTRFYTLESAKKPNLELVLNISNKVNSIKLENIKDIQNIKPM